MIRRSIDILVAGAGLLVTSPVLLIIAIAVVMDTGFPVFYRQARAGRRNRRFPLIKFRSMKSGQKGAEVTAAGDSRVTRTGRVLRKYKLDELPQLWNVLKGDMTLVGPRPEVPRYVDENDPNWGALLRVRPGLTDLATLIYRDEESILAQAEDPESYYRNTVLPAKLHLSRQYLDSHSPAADMRLFWLTIKYSLRPGEFDPATIRRAFLEEQ